MPPEVVAAGVSDGDTLVLTRDGGAEGGAAYDFFDYERDTPIIVLALLFAGVVGVVARLRGLASLLPHRQSPIRSGSLCSSARFAKRVTSASKASWTVPVGPWRCLPMMTSARPCAWSMSDCQLKCSSVPGFGSLFLR